MKTIILIINGGIGKHIAATAVIKNIVKKFQDRKLIVLGYYPEVFLNNPNVYRVYKSNCLQYFYEDFIKDKDTILLSQEVYQSTEYIVENKHLIQAWSECLNLNHEEQDPEIFLNHAEILDAKSKYLKDKPILVMQANGGSEHQNYSWTRDLPPFLAQEIINDLKDKYHIYLIKKPKQVSFKNAESLSFNNIREAMALLCISEKRLLIDSFLQHAAAALNKPSVVCWLSTKPEKLGYNIHTNIVPPDSANKFSHRLDNIFLEKDFVAMPHQCNIDLIKAFKKENILDAIYDKKV